MTNKKKKKISRSEEVYEYIVKDDFLSLDDFKIIMSARGWCSGHWLEGFPKFLLDNGVPENSLFHIHIWNSLESSYCDNVTKPKPKFRIQIDDTNVIYDLKPIYDPDRDKRIASSLLGIKFKN